MGDDASTLLQIQRLVIRPEQSAPELVETQEGLENEEEGEWFKKLKTKAKSAWNSAKNKLKGRAKKEKNKLKNRAKQEKDKATKRAKQEKDKAMKRAKAEVAKKTGLVETQEGL